MRHFGVFLVCILLLCVAHVGAAYSAIGVVIDGKLVPLSGLSDEERRKVLERRDREVERERLEAERERTERLAKANEAIDLYLKIAKTYAPGLVEPLIDYGSTGLGSPDCDAFRVPQTHAILIGVLDIGLENAKLEGPANDVELMTEFLIGRNVSRENIHALIGGQATRDGIAQAFRTVLDRMRCDDRVLLALSSHTVRKLAFIQIPASRGKFAKEFAALPENLSVPQLSKTIAENKMQFDPAKQYFIENAFDESVSDTVIFLSDNSELFHEVMLGRDISDFMIAARNRGGHTIALLDVNYAASAVIESRQTSAGDATAWGYVYSVEDGDKPGELGEQDLTLVPGAGDYAVFYASGDLETTPETLLPRGAPDARKFGLFTHTLVSAMAEMQQPTPRTIADSIQKMYQNDNRTRPHPQIKTSNADLAILAEATVSSLEDNAIRLLRPTPKRGGMRIERPELEIEGVVDWPAPVVNVRIGQKEAIFEATGHFLGKVQLKAGLNRIDITAQTADARLHHLELPFVYEGGNDALRGNGKRYAIIIANQNYGPESGFASLRTPFADADALASLLSSKYGFETKVQMQGDVVPLVLKDPTKREIQIALHRVGREVGQDDTVLIYYAGHGIFEQATSTAYWVPRDAEANFAPSYLSAADISAAVQRMQAGNLVLISDSCYSGGLMRGGAEAADNIDEQERTQALLRLQDRRSRVLITSGNNEPVEDLGGNGHSIFARALLTGLEHMEHDAFSSRELFDGYILQAVTANADQEPQFRPLEKVGHEGGDFVFVRSEMADANTAAAE